MNENASRILSLESLRGLLALWVTVGHTIKHSGYTDAELGVFAILGNPGLAVDCFIILSGFVIFMLLDRQRSSYTEFIVGRFFRLAPLFFLILVISALTLDWQVSVIANTPWKNQSIANDMRIHLDALQYLPQHLLAHFAMLHGAIADSILPSSQYAIVGPAWSISVEWQFYLIAPALFFLIAARRWYALAAVIVVVCVLRAVNYGSAGFAINQGAYFLIGIVSYFVWKKSNLIRQHDFRFIEVMGLLAIAIVYFTMSRTISLMLWVVVFIAIIAERHPAPSLFQRMFIGVLRQPMLQWMGRISYSIYMIHMLVLYAWFACLQHAFPEIGKFNFLMYALPLIVLTTLMLSALAYRFIEVPGMRLGKWLGKRSRPRENRAAPSLAKEFVGADTLMRRGGDAAH
ncbi:acyltransferase [Noviherbaspirillum cavernae]|uniref:Acyltransferase n=1 Tax=Noviherbaspirillum cavernae TaxID=2320862 RepID=A0A418WV73_9BURK|nr:acyltransferase [Noviherbaspirillum cavernae]RJF96567.1 acyltransferase [Noviherbaspirillum cavernae]